VLVDSRELAAIFAGGSLGAVARAELAEAIPYHAGQWPWATFIVNVAGAFLAGYFTTRLQERLPVSAYRRPLLGTGFCGALTTFSTMQLELLRMFDGGRIGLAFAYGLASVATGFLAVMVATNMVRAGEVDGVSLAVVVGVGVVGGVGAIARFGLDGAVAERIGREFPYGTLVVNALGAFVLCVLVGVALSQNAYRVVATGFVGAFTTFSTWALESHRLGEDGELRLGVVNFMVSLIVGVGATWAGRLLGGWL
jgi:CrcB protein